MDVLHTVRDVYGRNISLYQNRNRVLEGRAAARQLRTHSSSHTVLHEELEQRYVSISRHRTVKFNLGISRHRTVTFKWSENVGPWMERRIEIWLFESQGVRWT